MKEVYVDAVEDLPPNAPEPRGKSLQINYFVDVDHGGDKIRVDCRLGSSYLGIRRH